MLVLGGAGCGKTTAALAAARHHLIEDVTDDQAGNRRRVLFVTFSRTAVEQIRDRSSGLLAGLDDRIEISTFHGLAFRLNRAFGRYFGGPSEPIITGAARNRILGSNNSQLNYDELIPQALRILNSETSIARLIASRWSLVICDEFQDTDNHEWALLQAVSRDARTLLLADPNQMIYSGFKSGVTPERLNDARALPGCEQVDLPLRSHRDPTQVLPAAALAVRHRRFDDPAIERAIDDGRLCIHLGIPDDVELRAGRIAAEVSRCRRDGLDTCGIYVKTNADAAYLSEALYTAGIRHTPVGFSEAFGESVTAQLTLTMYAHGQVPWKEVAQALAVVATANDRKKDPPRLALLLVNGQPIAPEFDRRLEDLRTRLDSATTIQAVDVATDAWESLGITAGQREWDRAARVFTALATRTLTVDKAGLDQLNTEIAGLRNDSFITTDRGGGSRTQLMNFSQTKGREADAVILSYTGADFYGSATEPFDEASRIVYVSITRARQRVVVLLPEHPHPLIAPLANLARLP